MTPQRSPRRCCRRAGPWTIGGTATAFATIINPSTSDLNNCFISPVTALPVNFTYQTTDPATNAVTGTPNTPATIRAGSSQSFVLAVKANGAFAPTNVLLGFQCSYGVPAPFLAALNTFLLSASPSPVPDIVALGAKDGLLHLPGSGGVGAFAVATVNVGAGGTITARANTGGKSQPLAIALCQTDPQSGAWLPSSPPGPAVTATIAANRTPTFGIFVGAAGAVPFDPANNRIVVQFTGSDGAIRGETSVAVTTE